MAIEVLTGMPGAGKTTRLVATLRAAERAGRRVVTFYCSETPRLAENEAVSVHRVISARVEGTVFRVDHLVGVEEAARIVAGESPGTLLAFEEGQWFLAQIVPVWVEAHARGLDVIVTAPSPLQLDLLDQSGCPYERTQLQTTCRVCGRREAAGYFPGVEGDSTSVCDRCAGRLRRRAKRTIRKRLKKACSSGETLPYPIELDGKHLNAQRSAEAEWEILKRLIRVSGLPELDRKLSALILGSDTGFLCHRLRRWGFSTVVGVEPDPERRVLAELVDAYFHRDRPIYVDADLCDYLLSSSQTYDLTFAASTFALEFAGKTEEERRRVLNALADRTGALCIVAADELTATLIRGELANCGFGRVTRLDGEGYDGATLIVALADDPAEPARRRLARLAYPTVVKRLLAGANRVLPEDATVVVLSHGDEELVDLGSRHALHFPQDEGGAYAGSYPANGRELLDELGALVGRGAQYLVIPAPQLWWLDFYADFQEFLGRNALELLRDVDAGRIFEILKWFV